jgi:dimethylhistidine N-methyltransferase
MILPVQTLSLEERLTLRRAARRPAGWSFAEDVRRGLTAQPKVLLPRYFYDELGSHLFEAITALPEYYLTRSEEEILVARAGEIAAGVCALGGPVRLLELGSGSGRKTRLLIEALLECQEELEYLPIDVSESALRESGLRLLNALPALRVTAHLGEYHAALEAIQAAPKGDERTFALFLGSSLGNLDPEARNVLLQDLRAALRPGDPFLLGLDLKKDESVLLPAYDDALGVTAAFNLNLLQRINRELGGRFDLAAFRHQARYNQEVGRIEMHLESQSRQTVPIRALDLEVPFERGETIFTESSYKFDLDQVATLANATGFELRKTWTDGEGRFASNLLVAR